MGEVANYWRLARDDVAEKSDIPCIAGGQVWYERKGRPGVL